MPYLFGAGARLMSKWNSMQEETINKELKEFKSTLAFSLTLSEIMFESFSNLQWIIWFRLDVFFSLRLPQVKKTHILKCFN